LQFDEREWQKFNPGIHYQNRLRTADYCRKFTAHGFEVTEMKEWSGFEKDLNSVRLNAMFADRSREDLLVLGCHFLVRPT
jgi:hypothetical protein